MLFQQATLWLPIFALPELTYICRNGSLSYRLDVAYENRTFYRIVSSRNCDLKLAVGMAENQKKVRRPKKGRTREQLLQLAEDVALEKSFANISLDELAAAAGISKSGFLYHFNSKNELGLALIKRCTERQMNMLDDMFLRADDLHDDPLDSYLIAIKLFSEMIENDPSFNHSFLVNAYTFQDQYHIRGIREIGLGLLQRNRGGIIARLKRIAKKYPPKDGLDVVTLAEMTLSIVEGGMIISTLLKDRNYLPRQLKIYSELISHSFASDGIAQGN